MAGATRSSRRRSSSPPRSGSPLSAGRRSTTASTPVGRGWLGPVGAIRRPGSSAFGTWRSSSSQAGTRSVPTGVHASVLAGIPLGVPNRIPPVAPSHRRFPPRRPSAATRGGPRRIEIPVIRADGWSAHSTKDAARRSPARSPRCPPNRDPMGERSPGRSPLHPPTPGGSPTTPAGTHLVVLPAWSLAAPETVAVNLVVPGPAHVDHDEDRRAVGGTGGPSGAWNRPRCWPSTRCPTPTRNGAGRLRSR
jgi:hypothetical protein